MEETSKTLVEFLDANLEIGPLTVFAMYPLKEVTVSLKNGNAIYTMCISETEKAATYFFDEINKLPQIYKDRIIFKPLNLKLVKEAKIENEENALKYIDDFIRERMNKRVKREDKNCFALV